MDGHKCFSFESSLMVFRPALKMKDYMQIRTAMRSSTDVVDFVAATALLNLHWIRR